MQHRVRCHPLEAGNRQGACQFRCNLLTVLAEQKMGADVVIDSSKDDLRTVGQSHSACFVVLTLLLSSPRDKQRWRWRSDRGVLLLPHPTMTKLNCAVAVLWSADIRCVLPLAAVRSHYFGIRQR